MCVSFGSTAVFHCTRDNLGHVNLDSSCLQLVTSNPAFTVRRAFALAHASSPLTTTPICLCRALKILARGLSQLPTKSVTNVNIASGHSVLASIAAYSNATCTFITVVAFDIVFNGLTYCRPQFQVQFSQTVASTAAFDSITALHIGSAVASCINRSLKF